MFNKKIPVIVLTLILVLFLAEMVYLFNSEKNFKETASLNKSASPSPDKNQKDLVIDRHGKLVKIFIGDYEWNGQIFAALIQWSDEKGTHGILFSKKELGLTKAFEKSKTREIPLDLIQLKSGDNITMKETNVLDAKGNKVLKEFLIYKLVP